MAISVPIVVGSSTATSVSSIGATLTADIPASTPAVASVVFVFLHTVWPHASGFIFPVLSDNGTAGPNPGYRDGNVKAGDGPRVGCFCHFDVDPLTDSTGFAYVITNPLSAGNTITAALGFTVDYVRMTLIAVTGMGRETGEWIGSCNSFELAASGSTPPYDNGWEGDCALHETFTQNAPNTPPGMTLGLYHVTNAVYPTGGLTFDDGAVTVLDSYADVGASVASGVIGYLPITPPVADGTTFAFGATPSVGIADNQYAHVDGIWMQPGLGLAYCPGGPNYPVFDHHFRASD